MMVLSLSQHGPAIIRGSLSRFSIPPMASMAMCGILTLRQVRPLVAVRG